MHLKEQTYFNDQKKKKMPHDNQYMLYTFEMALFRIYWMNIVLLTSTFLFTLPSYKVMQLYLSNFFP